MKIISTLLLLIATCLTSITKAQIHARDDTFSKGVISPTLSGLYGYCIFWNHFISKNHHSVKNIYQYRFCFINTPTQQFFT